MRAAIGRMAIRPVAIGGAAIGHIAMGHVATGQLVEQDLWSGGADLYGTGWRGVLVSSGNGFFLFLVLLLFCLLF